MLGGQSWQRVKTSDTNMSALVRTLAWGLVDQISSQSPWKRQESRDLRRCMVRGREREDMEPCKGWAQECDTLRSTDQDRI